MIRSSRCVDGKECCCLSTGNIVGTWNVNCEANDVVDVDVVSSSGVNGDFNNQFGTRAKGTLGARSLLSGTRCWFGGKSLAGSQSSLSRIAFARSQMVSEMTPHSKGQGFPPKLSQSIIRRMPI